MTTPLISTILPTFEDWPFSDNVTPCAARVGEEFGSGSRIVSLGGERGLRLRYTPRTPDPAPSRPRLSHLGGQAGTLDGGRHTGGLVEVSNAGGDSGDQRHCRMECRPRMRIGSDREPRLRPAHARVERLALAAHDEHVPAERAKRNELRP